MKLACLTVTAKIEQSASLKDKRSVVKRLCAGLRREFGASVCEDAWQDDRKTLGLGIALACADTATAQRMVQAIERALYEEPALTHVELEREIY